MSKDERGTSEELSVEQLSGVGEQRAWWLACAGFRTVTDVANADVDDVTVVDGFGETRAQQLVDEARDMLADDDAEDGGADTDADGDDEGDGPAGSLGGPVAIYGDDSHLPEAIRQAEAIDEVEVGTDEREALVDEVAKLDQAIIDSPFRPDALVTSEFSGWHVVAKMWCVVMRNSPSDYAPTYRGVEPQWPAFQTHVTNGEGERVQIRVDPDDAYSDLTSEGWKLFFRNNERAVIDRSRHALLVNEDEFEWTFTNKFEEEHPRGTIYRNYDVDVEDAADELGVDVDEAEQTANKTYWDEASDDLVPPEDDEWHHGPMDSLEDRELLRHTGGNSSYTVEDNPGGGEGSTTFTSGQY